MRMRLSELKKLIRESLRKSSILLNENSEKTPEAMIAHFKKNDHYWNDVREQYRQMALGGQGESNSRDHYAEWENKDFRKVINALDGVDKMISFYEKNPDKWNDAYDHYVQGAAGKEIEDKKIQDHYDNLGWDASDFQEVLNAIGEPSSY